MAKHHRSRKRSGGISGTTQVLIAALVFLFLISGGASIVGQYLGFLDLSQWHIGQRGDNTGLILGAVAIVAGLAILLWRRMTGGTGEWSRKIFGIHSIKDIYALTPGQFEQFVGYLFSQAGYEVQVVGHSGDEGIDLEMRHHTPHGTVRVVAQCKRYQGSVGQPIVREFFGSFADHAAEGFLVTTGTFTEPAKEWAASRPLKLIDGPALLQWTEEVARKVHGQGVHEKILTSA